MKYKVGDRVKINGDISKIGFLRVMKGYCGKVVTIDQIDVTLDRYKIKEDNGMWHWYEEVFEGYAFEYGSEIEVCNYDWPDEKWQKAIYVCYIDGQSYPYTCVLSSHKKDFKAEREYLTQNWRYARPIQKKHTIIIDNKEIEISEESYQRLKESLCL